MFSMEDNIEDKSKFSIWGSTKKNIFHLAPYFGNFASREYFKIIII